jgi:Escherichia/Staphylococcus phage prohead protease
MDRIGFKFEIKSVSESDGTFEGLASTYNNVDMGGDSVQVGAFSKTLKNANGRPFPVLAGHDPREQIGYAHLEDSHAGLIVKGKLVLHSEKARQSYALMKAGALRGLSIGYDAVRSVMKDGVRLLQEVKLYEVSTTAFPMNESAMITLVKGSADPAGHFRRMMAQCAREIRRVNDGE